MKHREYVLIALGIMACASSEQQADAVDDASRVPVTAPDAGEILDAGDAGDDVVDGPACSDCEYFPETCSDDVLCSNGLFGPKGSDSFDPRTQINVIRGRSPNDVWIAGAMGAIAHFDGTSWVRSDPGHPETMRALWLGDFGEVSLGMLDRIYLHDENGWTAQYLIGHTISRQSWMTSAWTAPGSSSLWCATVARDLGETTGLWRLSHSPSTGFALRPGIPNEVCRVAGCSQMLAIHGPSANDLWAVGMGGSIVRIIDAESEEPNAVGHNSQTWNSLNGVWAASESEAWAVGVMGTIRHFTGAKLWEIVPSPTAARLNAIWGTSASDVWAVGEGAIVLHYDGKSWSRAKIGGLGMQRPNLTAVWAAAPGRVWIGGEGVLLSLGGKP